MRALVAGDDRIRDYELAWHGVANVGGTDRETALLVTPEGEALVVLFGRTYVAPADETIRDMRPVGDYPALTQERLDAAL